MFSLMFEIIENTLAEVLIHDDEKSKVNIRLLIIPLHNEITNSV